MAISLLTPINDQQINGNLARVAATVTDGVAQLREQATYFLGVLTEDNRAAGLIVKLGGPDVTPLTAEEVAQYRVFWQQVELIADWWGESQGGVDAATTIVLPWGTAP